MNPAFNKMGFEATFAAALAELAGAEKITREHMRKLSRDVLEAHHATENVAYINQLIPVLTPINRKVAILFFKAFSGFKWDDETQRFTSKNKKHYDEKHKASMEWLADPLNNIWVWADRHVEVEEKPPVPLTEKVKQFVQDTLKKAGRAGISQADILEAVFAGGIEPGVVVAVFDKMGLEFNVKEEEEQGE